jgi:hypothetical protein
MQYQLHKLYQNDGTLRALMTIGSNNLMYEAREFLSAPRLKPLNAHPFLSAFRRKGFIHLKTNKYILVMHTYHVSNNNLLHAIYKKMFLKSSTTNKNRI